MILGKIWVTNTPLPENTTQTSQNSLFYSSVYKQEIACNCKNHGKKDNIWPDSSAEKRNFLCNFARILYLMSMHLKNN